MTTYYYHNRNLTWRSINRRIERTRKCSLRTLVVKFAKSQRKPLDLKLLDFAEAVAVLAHCSAAREQVVFASSRAGGACLGVSFREQSPAFSAAFFALDADGGVGCVSACAVADFASDAPIAELSAFASADCLQWSSLGTHKSRHLPIKELLTSNSDSQSLLRKRLIS